MTRTLVHTFVAAATVVLLMFAMSRTTPAASGPQPCSRTSVSVYYVNGKPVAVDTLFAYNESDNAYDIPLVTLDDVAKFLHAESSFDGTTGTLTAGNTVATFVVGSRKVTVGEKPVADLVTAPLVSNGRLYVSGGLAARFLGTTNEEESVTDYQPADPSGHLIDVPAQCRPGPLTAAQRALVASTKMPYPERAAKTPFCSDHTNDKSQQVTFDSYTVAAHPMDDALRRRAILFRANTELCNGYYAAAYRDLSTMRAYYASDNSGGEERPEFERRYILAASMTAHADAALALLRKTARGNTPRAYFDGDLCGAMKSFAAEDARFPRMPDEIEYVKAHGEPGPHLQGAVDAACAGDVAGAIAQMHAVTGDATALYEMMLGALYARQKKWDAAAAEWWTAEGDYPGVPAMEEIEMSDPQFESRWLLYYYRAHIAELL